MSLSFGIEFRSSTREPGRPPEQRRWGFAWTSPTRRRPSLPVARSVPPALENPVRSVRRGLKRLTGRR